uniref:LEC14B protein n=1 Tax=Rhizophora mucronata TaxID=61149 RepID=A0A2P2LTK9_RHIMU
MRPIEMRLLFYLLSALQYMFSSFLLSRVRTCNHILLAFPMQCDVNTVCFADETGHLIYSGSDDSLCKVWDRRCFITKGQAAGVLMGHLEGITFINSHGDGWYFISNGKDQTTKLWDIRKMSSNAT